MRNKSGGFLLILLLHISHKTVIIFFIKCFGEYIIQIVLASRDESLERVNTAATGAPDLGIVDLVRFRLTIANLLTGHVGV